MRMPLNADLFDVFRDLPKLDDVAQRKSLLTGSGHSAIGTYLDWSGSRVEFAQEVIDEAGRRGQTFMVNFLAGVARAPQVRDSLDWTARLEAVRVKIDALPPDAWLREFPPRRLTARDRTGLMADRDLLASTVISAALLPYFALGRQRLAAQAGSDAAEVAADVADRLRDAMADDPAAFHRFAGNPRAEEPALLGALQRLLREDDTLAQDLVKLLTPESETSQLEQLLWSLTRRLEVDRPTAQPPGSQPVREDAAKEIDALVASQREVAARGHSLSPRALYDLGQLAAYKRDYDGALGYFREAAQADPEYSAAFWAIAWLQQAQAQDDIINGALDAAAGRLAEARTAGRQTDPNDPLALTQRGYTAKALAQLADRRGDRQDSRKYYQEAAECFAHVARVEPGDPGAQNGLGNVQHALGNLDAAIAAYRRAVELEPRYTAAYHDLAIACEQKMEANPRQARKWRQEALGAWRKAYSLAPGDPGFTPDYIVTMGQHIQQLEQG